MRRPSGHEISSRAECGRDVARCCCKRWRNSVSNLAIPKAGIPVDGFQMTIDAWRAVLAVQGAEDGYLTVELYAVKVEEPQDDFVLHRLDDDTLPMIERTALLYVVLAAAVG